MNRLLFKGGALPEQAQKRLVQIFSTDEEAFKKCPRLRMLALRQKKTICGLSGDQEAELVQLENRPKKGSRSPSMKCERRRRHSAKPMRGMKVRKMFKGKMDQTVDQRPSQLLPSIVAEVKRSITTNTPANCSIHRGFICDGCKQKPIVGVRFCCRPCNFDLCATCEKTVKH